MQPTATASGARSSAKNVIYQTDDGRPITPLRKGTKGPPGGLVQQPAPFATASVPDDERYPADMHLVHKGKQEVTGKTGAASFDPAVYATNIESNARNMADSKQRNYAGGGAPYACVEGAQNASFICREFHLQEVTRELPAKIGSGGAAAFDAEPYRQSLADRLQLTQERQQKCGGAGIDGASGAGCPFATCDSAELQGQWAREHYRAKPAAKSMADKVGAERSFDPSVYSAAITANRAQQAESTLRSFVGSGSILGWGGK